MAEALIVAPVNSGITTPASAIHATVIAPTTTMIIQNSWEASRNASRRRPCCNSSVNTGTNAADSAAWENRLETRLGIWEAIVNDVIATPVAKKLAWTTSRASPAIRDTAVAIAKIAVLTARRRCGPAESDSDPPLTGLRVDTGAL